MDRTLLLTAIDLTRACAAHERYLDWLALYEPVLSGSLGIANYFGLAAESFQRVVPPNRNFDELEAHELFADVLMAGPPMSSEELTRAARPAIHECCCSATEP